MSDETQLPDDIEFPTPPLRPDQLADPGGPGLTWLWQGYLAQQKVTALISQSKSGKTTLTSHLYARMQAGGQLAGLAVVPGRALVVTEEDRLDWDVRCQHLGIGPNVQFVCRPFNDARPTEAQWFSLIASIEKLHRREGLQLVVIDTLATLLPGYAETCAPKLLDCLLPLQSLAKAGPAVLLVHHPGRGARADGQAARGSSALGGFVDILMEMSHFKRARHRDRRRRIRGYSRHVETPRHLVIELNAEGSDYQVHTDAAGAVLVSTWPPVQYLLTYATDKLTRDKILAEWPVDGDPPDRSTLQRWLTRATEQGLICRSGSGYRGDAFRYWLPGREPLLFPGHHASEAEKQAWRDRLAAHERELRERRQKAP